MNRRQSIRNLAIATGAVITLPQWMISCGVADTNTHASSFSSSEQSMLSSVADTIIPVAAGSIGAVSVGVDKFLQKLFDDCYDKEVQGNIKKQLRALADSAKKTHDRRFGDCTQAQREQLLLQMANSYDKAQKDFFTLVKTETIRGFNTSQKVMQEYLGYKVAPGHYYGCVEVKG